MSARDDPHLDVDPAAAVGTSGSSSPDAPAAEPPPRPPSTSEAALVARVVAWHNRHPLARRLGPAEVGGQGHLSLPCELPPARPEASWRRWLPTRLLWRWRLRPAFDEPTLIPGLSARRIAAFAHRHAGVERSGGEPGWPERVVPMRAGAQNAVPRHLMTVAIKRGAGESQRILIGPGPAQPVLGRRQWSRPRLITAGLASLLLLGAALGGAGWWGARPATATAMVATSAAGPASASASAAHAAHAVASHANTPAAAAESVAASAPAEALQGVAAAVVAPAGAAASAASHPPAEPASSPTAVAEAKDERPAVDAQAAKVQAPAVERAPPIASIRPPRPVLKPSAPVRSHALVTAPTWHRAETEGRRTRLLRLLGGQVNGLQLDVIRLPEGEVLALWPLPTQADAEVLARRLKSSGITMLAVDF